MVMLDDDVMEALARVVRALEKHTELMEMQTAMLESHIHRSETLLAFMERFQRRLVGDTAEERSH